MTQYLLGADMIEARALVLAQGKSSRHLPGPNFLLVLGFQSFIILAYSLGTKGQEPVPGLRLFQRGGGWYS